MMLINIKNNFGRTPFLASIGEYLYVPDEDKEAYLNILKQLLEAKGIDVNIGKGSPKQSSRDQSTEDGETALHMATKQDCLELVKFLLTIKEIDVNRRTKSGKTPLHIAAKQGYTDVMQLLVKAGADINIENYAGETPLGLAQKQGIKEYCFIKSINIFDAIGNRNLEDVQKAINAGQIEAVNDRGMTPLCVAVEEGDVKIVDLLLKHEAKVNVIADADDEWTPLHYAAYNGHYEIAEKLLESGANVKAEDKYQGTPLGSVNKIIL